MNTRITEDKYPFLKNLRPNSGALLSQNDVWDATEPYNRAIFKDFEDNLQVFKSNIYFIGASFSRALSEAFPKFKDLTNHGASTLKGSYIEGRRVFMANCTYERDRFDGYLFVFDPFVGTLAMAVTPNGAWLSQDFAGAVISKPDYLRGGTVGDGVAGGEIIAKEVWAIGVLSVFLKYAEVETKILPPNSKVKEGKKKYKNDTKSNITLLDSRWFTTLVKSDAFKVRGHFRLQPHGEGRKERKLIWINEFKKNGYTAPARMLSHEMGK